MSIAGIRNFVSGAGKTPAATPRAFSPSNFRVSDGPVSNVPWAIKDSSGNTVVSAVRPGGSMLPKMPSATRPSTTGLLGIGVRGLQNNIDFLNSANPRVGGYVSPTPARISINALGTTPKRAGAAESAAPTAGMPELAKDVTTPVKPATEGSGVVIPEGAAGPVASTPAATTPADAAGRAPLDVRTELVKRSYDNIEFSTALSQLDSAKERLETLKAKPGVSEASLRLAQTKYDDALRAGTALVTNKNKAIEAAASKVASGRIELRTSWGLADDGTLDETSRLATGKLWGDGAHTGTISGSDLEQLQNFAKRAHELYTEADSLASAGDAEAATVAASEARAYTDQLVAMKRDLGQRESEKGLFGYYRNDGTRVRDASEFMAWAQIISPLLALGVTTAVTVSENRSQRQWTEEENEKERQQRLDEIKLTGDYRLAAAGIESSASAKPAINATSGTLGGSFQSA